MLDTEGHRNKPHFEEENPATEENSSKTKPPSKKFITNNYSLRHLVVP
jgi:hypothetical protein